MRHHTNCALRVALTAAALGTTAAAQQLFQIDGSAAQTSAKAGWSVSDLGDVNGDGAADFLVGSPAFVYGGAPVGPGAVRVHSGATGAVLYTRTGAVNEDKFGISVSGIGDVNGDGINDFVVGAHQGFAPSGPQPNGYVRFYSGATGALLATVSRGFSPVGVNPEAFGLSVSGVGDVNNDGVPDAIVGAPNDGAIGFNSGPGRVYVYSGASIAAGAPVAIYNIAGPLNGSRFGYSVSDAGDVDLDGTPDFVVGSPTDSDPANPLSQFGDGAARVYSGATGALMFLWRGGLGSFDNFGESVSSAGLVDGDANPDIIVGAINASSPGSPGSSDGSATVLSGNFIATGAGAAILYTFYGDDLYRFAGVSCPSLFGCSVSGAGDVNQDGFDDLLVGARGDHHWDPDSTLYVNSWPFIGAITTGGARLLSGQDGAILKTWFGDSQNDAFGYAVSSAGDVDQDGRPDVLVGAPQDDNTGTDTGMVRVFAGNYLLGTIYGTAVPNSFGVPALISATGSLSVAGNQLTLTVTGLPPGTSGQFFYGPTMLATPVPLNNGNRWVGGTLYRLPTVTVGPAGPSGTATLVQTLDFTSGPMGSGPGAILPGTEWNLQFFYRNAVAPPGFANLSDAVNFGFLP